VADGEEHPSCLPLLDGRQADGVAKLRVSTFVTQYSPKTRIQRTAAAPTARGPPASEQELVAVEATSAQHGELEGTERGPDQCRTPDSWPIAGRLHWKPTLSQERAMEKEIEAPVDELEVADSGLEDEDNEQNLGDARSQGCAL
jgi:hypothetical protein